MRIAYLYASRMPTEKAHGYQTAQVCQAFMEEGAELTLIAPSRDNPMAHLTPRAHYNLRVDLPIDWSAGTDYLARVGRLPNSFRIRLIDRLAAIATQLSHVRAALRPLRAAPPNAIYLRGAQTLFFAYLLLPPALRRRCFLELHSLPNGGAARWALRWLMRRIGGTLPVTQFMTDELIATGIARESLLTAPDGVDIESFGAKIDRAEARSTLGLPKDGPIALYAGRFHTLGMDKGLADILTGAGGLMRAHPDFSLCFVGGPMDRVPHYRAIMARAGIDEGRVIFHDLQPASAVPRYLRAADILLMPFPNTTHFAGYASPLKMFEYMAAGRPIVATRLPAVMEVLEDGRNALLAEPGDPASIAGAIDRLLSDPALAARLGDNAAREAPRYGWRARARTILDFIEKRTGTHSSA